MRMRLLFALVRRVACAAAVCGTALLATCARDVTGGGTAPPYPNTVRMVFQTRDAFTPDLWYYMVFNFTATAPSAEQSPFDEVSHEDRGRNWQLYVAYHPQQGDQLERWVTLQRPALPTVIPVGAGPTDMAVADFGGDAQPDIAVACTREGTVQLVRALEVTSANILDPIYYDNPIDVHTGVAPRLLFDAELNGDNARDLILIDAGNDTTPAEVRVLARTGDSTFTPGTAIPLAGRPEDAVFTDLNADTRPDLAVATSGPGAAHQIEVLLNNNDGTFGAPVVSSVPEAIRQIGAGDLSGDNVVDLGVGMSTPGGANAILVLNGDDSGSFTPGETRSVAGELRGLTVGDINGTLNDIVATYTNAAGGGIAAAFIRDQNNTVLAAAPVEEAIAGRSGYVIIEDAGQGSDQRRDAIIVDGDGTAGDRFTIMRGEREVDANNTAISRFIWNTEPINYPSALSPVRVKAVNLNPDTTLDFIAANSGAGDDGDSISLYFGLGKYNFTNDDIYWTDDPPNDLTSQPWLISKSVGLNTMEIVIDPFLFFDLARQPPQQPSLGQSTPGFFVQFMTATTGIDLLSNPDQLGLVKDMLQEPVAVRMIVGDTYDEIQTPLAKQNVPPIAAEDIINWGIEVL
jgi:hypothetical protein